MLLVWVIWPVKIVPEMTYKVSSRTLNLYSLIQKLLPNSFSNIDGISIFDGIIAAVV